MSGQEKEVCTEMLYNKKTVLALDFIEMKKVKREVVVFEKILTVDYKAYQVLGF